MIRVGIFSVREGRYFLKRLDLPALNFLKKEGSDFGFFFFCVQMPFQRYINPVEQINRGTNGKMVDIAFEEVDHSNQIDGKVNHQVHGCIRNK